MADEEGTGALGDDEQAGSPDVPQPDASEPCTEIRMELRDSLPGDRAVVGVESDGEFMWLASRKHVSEQAVSEFLDQFQHLVREGWWIQNWTGR